jgi:hypothetical protein
MTNARLLGGSVLILCASATAQDFLGFSHNTAVSAASRGSIGLTAGEVMTRIDGSEAAGWGTATPGFRTLRSIACIVQDKDAATVETFDITLYPENTLLPGFPDLAHGVAFATAVPGPSGTGGVAELRVVTPATPVAVPIQGGGDVFVSFVLPAATGTDGLSMQVVLGFDAGPSFPTFDVPGAVQGVGAPVPAASPATSHFLSRTGPTTLNYNTRRQCWLDVAHDGAGGMGLTITNQVAFGCSKEPAPEGYGPAPGTGDFLSGSAPDAAGSNTGRADDIAMRFVKSGLGDNRLVVFLLDQDLSPEFGAELPVSQWFAGATGSMCLVQPEIVAFAPSVNGEAWHVTRVPNALRGTLSGYVVKQQAACIDQNGVIHAGACDAMHF